MMNQMPSLSVSVVIPTIGRPELVRALASALSQEFPIAEVIVCLDGAELPMGLTFDDSRVSLVRVGPGAGGNAARQAGIDAARGDVVALLDDDDEWDPGKLTAQMALVDSSGVNGDEWVSTCRVTAQLGGRQEVWPARLIGAGERITPYLTRKRSLVGGQGFMQSSTLVFPRSLALRVPFDTALPFHQDTDWLVRSDRACPGLCVLHEPRPLVHYFVTTNSISGGGRISPDGSAQWALSRLAHDPRSLGDFICTTSAGYAARRGEPSAVTRLVALAFRAGSPGFWAVAYACAQFGLSVVSAVRRRFSG